MIPRYKNVFALLLVASVYTLLTMLSVNNGYFWDNIQLISKSAHWFYQSGFDSFIIPLSSEGNEISASGYHPPLMGLITAGLWKIFGYQLWVSHVFTFLWAIVLIYNLWKLIRLFFSEKYQSWVLVIVLLESSLLTQFSIASPDFILFTAFVISLRGILQKKQWLTAIGIFFLCFVNMRGVFAGVIIFLVSGFYSLFQQTHKPAFKDFVKHLLPFLPTFILLIIYFATYLYTQGWFFTSTSPYSGHYTIPQNITGIVKHLAEFILRSGENGRFIIWLFGIYSLFTIIKFKHKTELNIRFLFWIFAGLNGIYVLFIFISQMPFSARYFLPQFFLLTLLTMWSIVRITNEKHIKWIFILFLIFELTGHLWIYPDKISKSWDNTLAHFPYYELRKECFNYIDQQELNYNDISGGFCYYGNRKYIELKNDDKIVGVNTQNKYFIYSNISNIDDSLYHELNTDSVWRPLKKFRKGFVKIILYKSLKNQPE